MRHLRGYRLAVGLALALVLTACSGSNGPSRSPWAHLAWRASSVPVPTGSRALVRAATWCAGRWVVVGATADAVGDTRPAVWASGNGRVWRPLTLHPRGDYYAAREILSSVGCSHGRLAAIGAKPGGAHGLPRTATWEERPDGSLAAVHASYLLYGGTNAVDVSRLEGGRAGFAIAGTRTAGAAFWTSRTGHAFTLHDRAPGLISTPGRQTAATDVLVSRDRVVVGTAVDDSGRLTATAWTPSGRGRWTQATLPGGRTISTADLIVSTPGGPLTAGLLDRAFGLWLDHGGTWTLAGSFGARDPRGTTSPFVSGLTSVGGQVVASYADGRRFHLVAGPAQAEMPSDLPVDIPVRGDTTVSVVSHGPDLLLLTDDGRRGRVWTARAP